jgi:hypothetical protein
LCGVYAPGVGVWLVKCGVPKAQGHIYARLFLGLFSNKKKGLELASSTRDERAAYDARFARAELASLW